jgi:hypothetical protein
MAKSTELEDAAKALAEVLAGRTDAVDELLRRADGRKVSLLIARQHLMEARDGGRDDELTTQAISMIEEALQRGTWHE